MGSFTNRLKRITLWEKKHHLLPHLIVFFIFTFLFAKVFFRRGAFDPVLFAYGITVTSVILLQFIVAFFFYKDPYKKAVRYAKKDRQPADADKPYMVSCLVAVYNEETIIRKCVESLCAQTYPHKEIIFVDDCSTDSTPQLLDQLAREYPITVIHLTKNAGKKPALCQAVLASKGEILAFTDSDSIWKPDAVEKVVEIFRYLADVGAVSGHTTALNADKNFLTKVQDSWYEGQYSVRKAFESYFGAVTCVSGPLAAFRREAIYNYLSAWEKDRFLGQEFRFATDRTLTGYVLGARYRGKKIKHQSRHSPFAVPDYPVFNYKIVYSKSARALTEVPDSFIRVIRQQIRWKKSFIRNSFFTGSFFWRKPLLPALVYYLHILFVLAGPFIALRHIVYLPLQGNLYSLFLYLSGIMFIGFMFGFAYKLENPKSHYWIYRPFMSILSTLVLSWLIFYSALTIRKMRWYRG